MNDQQFFDACRNGDLFLVKLMIQNGINKYNCGMQYACRAGRLHIVTFLIEKGADSWDVGLYNSCIGGHLQIAQLMIDHGATQWNLGLYYSCEGGHIELIHLMVEKGAKELHLLTPQHMYNLLERGVAIDRRFETTLKFKELFQDIQLFRRKICSFAVHYLIPDLLGLVSEYSLK